MTMQNTRQPSPQIYSVERVNTRFDTIFQELAARDQRAAQRIQRAVAQDFTPIGRVGCNHSLNVRAMQLKTAFRSSDHRLQSGQNANILRTSIHQPILS